LPSGCVTANVSTLPCVLTGAGTSSITVTVRDASGVVASSPALPFIVAIDPTVGSPTASPPLVDQGGSSTLAVAAAGGTGTLLYLWQGLPSSCPSRQATLLCTFSSLGAWTVNVTVTDAAGYSVVSSPLTLLAVALPTVNVSASKVLIDLGQSLTFLTLVHGGVPNFTYSWSGLPCGGTLVGASTITCVPTATGAYNVSVSIVDATGAAATSRPVELSVAVPPSITGFNATSYQVPVGGTSTFTVAAQGGAGPLHYTYSGLPRGCTTQNSASLTCVFQHQGNFTVGVVVSDTVGAAVSANLTVHATGGAPRSTVPPPPPLGFVALLLGLSLIAVTTVLGLAFVLFRGARLEFAPPLNGFTGLQRGRPPWVAPDTNPRRADPRGLPRSGPDGGASGPPPRSEPHRRV
ncbi:MAG: hypothetical protein KGI89_13565, partial [Euryarchaeota archaeon]|nr:hypothetical protein [Euryarchaeota archaeon]